MITAEHVVEVALLVLVAYLTGCVLGYCAHIAARAFANRPRFETRLQAQVLAAAQMNRPETLAPAAAPRSAARRLAGAVDRDDAPSVPQQSVPTQQRPPDLPSPRGGKPDDLKKIKGIGAKTESSLNDLGVYHLDQVAAWQPAHIDWLEGRIAVRGRIRREQWVEQAILLATATAPT
ncbi:hypothetical protein [Devosia salina]|uniref:NADH-quinone oxidoreductase subunit E n=1 Tax=Devosia salina TaxID=2860336 RepID=A0ABX8WIL6_9HYPH|nr:hypothetical protein [Devosia salina]QYO78120.1 hypothetical protein K1X15_06055 [Devosia salina]